MSILECENDPDDKKKLKIIYSNTHGEELAKISYSNQISFGEFINNAEEFIQATKEKKLRE